MNLFKSKEIYVDILTMNVPVQVGISFIFFTLGYHFMDYMLAYPSSLYWLGDKA